MRPILSTFTISMLGLGLACTSKQPKHEPASAPRLELSLPAGVEVTVDGEPRGTTPLGLDLEPGMHAIGLATECATAELERTLVAGQTTRIERGDVKGIGFATLQVTAKSVEGEVLVHALSVDDEVVGRGERSEVVLSACPHRVVVSSDGLGSWTEAIAFGRDETVKREVTLSLGPDMVRIPGGHFRMGPPGPSRYIPGLQSTEDLEPHEQQGWYWVHPFEVDVATFDIDRTEVTAAQFHACRQNGKCPWDAMRLRATDYPSQDVIDLCTTDGRPDRKPLPGKENHPINCIARWEAEIYCASVGKRLPTDAEWEYAARGGREDYYCPWGPMTEEEEDGRGNCVKPRDSKGTEPVCSHPDENSLHGLCDMAFNVAEYVMWTKGRETFPYQAELDYGDGEQIFILLRGGYGSVSFRDFLVRDNQERSGAGFRCVRDLKTGSKNDGD